MTLQFIRRNGKIAGVAILLGRGWVNGGVGDRAEYWRICEHCKTREALVFCQSHCMFVCDRCLNFHGRTAVNGDFIFGFSCRLISMAVARDLAQVALSRTEVEA